jgi:hypothetical protein
LPDCTTPFERWSDWDVLDAVVQAGYRLRAESGSLPLSENVGPSCGW